MRESHAFVVIGCRRQNVWLAEVVGSTQPVQIAPAGLVGAAALGTRFLPPRSSENGAPGTFRSIP